MKPPTIIRGLGISHSYVPASLRPRRRYSKRGNSLTNATRRKSAADRLGVLQLLWDEGLNSNPIINQQNQVPGYSTTTIISTNIAKAELLFYNAVRFGNLDVVKWLV